MCNLWLFCPVIWRSLQGFDWIWVAKRYRSEWKLWNSFLLEVFLTKMELKHHWMIFDFSKLKNSISCSCIFRKSITSQTKLCNSARHFYYRFWRAATAMWPQMSKIFGHAPGKAKPTCLSRLCEFDLLTDDEVLKLIRSSTIKACKLDPLPAIIMQSCYSALVPVFKAVINLSLSTGSMPEYLKIASLCPLSVQFEVSFKTGWEVCINFVQLNNCLQECFQSAYKVHHSTETPLL